jgi:hypothetical protein
MDINPFKISEKCIIIDARLRKWKPCLIQEVLL